MLFLSTIPCCPDLVDHMLLLIHLLGQVTITMVLLGLMGDTMVCVQSSLIMHNSGCSTISSHSHQLGLAVIE
mgnify:CR=1 FL=1